MVLLDSLEKEQANKKPQQVHQEANLCSASSSAVFYTKVNKLSNIFLNSTYL